jgi:hypothetical protein
VAVIDRERWEALEPLLDRALALSAEEQSAWLDELTISSPDLAADVGALLSGESAADRQGFLVEPLELKLSGLELGAYSLEHPLGQGGMGSVWLARRVDGRFEGQVAIKLLNLALVSTSGQERFRREGSMLARLTHPGIARLLDAGVSDSGQPYLVLEYVDGRPIDSFATAHRLDVRQRVQLFLQVLAAVGHAHANLVVHRDLKPNNILVTADGTVKLLDFGIGKLIDAEGSAEHSTITMETGRALTPDFAAPEQVRGETITTATDVYALGTLLYLLVSGRHPTTEGARTAPDALMRVLSVEPARLKLGDLDTILAKALRKDARGRYQTVAAFADDLERYLRAEPVGARPDSVAYRTRMFLRRNRAGVAAASVVVAALAAAMVFSLSQMREARRQRDAALDARKRADAQAEFQGVLMSQIGERPITMREILDRGNNILQRQYAGDQKFLASMLVQLSMRYAELGDTKMTGTVLAHAESIAVAGHYQHELADIQCAISSNLLADNHYVDARRWMSRADSTLRTIHDPDVETNCLQIKANLEMDTGHADSALTLVRRAIAIQGVGSGDLVQHIDLMATLAEALSNTGRARDAIETYRHSLHLLDSNGRSGMMQRNLFQHNLAVTLFQVGETAESEELLSNTLKVLAVSDKTGRLPPLPLSHYAFMALYQGHLDSAHKYLSILARQGAADHAPYWEGIGLFGLVQADVRLGRMADARRTAARFRAISDNPALANATDIVDYRLTEATLAQATGDYATAYTKSVEVLQASGYFSGKRRRALQAPLILAAENALMLGKSTEALGLARGALANAARDSAAQTRSAYIGEARLIEARALLSTGDTSAARASLGRAIVALRNGAGAQHPRTGEAETLLQALSR